MNRTLALRIIGFAVILVLLVIVAFHFTGTRRERAEQPAPAETPVVNTPAAVDEKPEEGGCLVVRLRGAPNSINPIIQTTNPDSQAVNLVFDDMIEYTKDFEPRSAQAAKVSASNDHRVYTIRLDPRGRWQNGHPVTFGVPNGAVIDGRPAATRRCSCTASAAPGPTIP